MTTTKAFRRLRPLGLAALTVAVLALGGCSVGSYPVDYLQEMHYSQSVRLQEPPRLAPPAGAVAFRGVGPDAELAAGPAYNLLPRAQAEAIARNPRPDSPALRAEGALFFQRNCAVCHGAQGDGQGSPIVVASFRAAGALPPADLVAQATRARTDGSLFWTITHGQGEVPVPPDARDDPRKVEAYGSLTNMPAFRALLTPDQRWALVRHIRALQGQ